MDRRIQAVLQAMHDGHCRSRIADLARSVNLSTGRFIHLFKVETSHPPKRYMRSLQMEEAQELLQKSFLSVKEIAARLGVGDRSHFSRDFKRISGYSPSDYRKRDEKQQRNC